MRAGAMAKSTFVTAPSFASSGSVTSINHVPLRPSPSGQPLARSSLYLLFVLRFWPTHAIRSYRGPPYFPPPPPVLFHFHRFLFFFFGSLLYVPPARARASARSCTLSRKCIHRAEIKFREPPYRICTNAPFWSTPVYCSCSDESACKNDNFDDVENDAAISVL